MTPPLSVVPSSVAAPVKIVFERHVRPGADAAFREWSQRFVQTATRFPGHEGASVLAVPNSDSQFVLVRFASAADLEQWQRSDEYVALMREADTLGPAGEYSETRTGMETWFHASRETHAREAACEVEDGADDLGGIAPHGGRARLHLRNRFDCRCCWSRRCPRSFRSSC